MSKSYIEVCEDCNSFYAGDSFPFLCFGISKYESKNEEEEYTLCCVCRGSKKKIKRHKSFMDALKLSKNTEYLQSVESKFRNLLSETAMRFLLNLISKMSVPSFCIIYNHSIHDYKVELQELAEKDLIRYIVNKNDEPLLMRVVLNAEKLNLYSNKDILNVIGVQEEFKVSYFDKESPKKHYLKRKRNIDIMINDFTLNQKNELIEKFDGKCAFTGKSVDLHLDHVIPISWRVEGTTLSNMLPISKYINSSKGNKNVFSWYDDYKIKYEIDDFLFEKAMTYIADLNGMSLSEYKKYTYDMEMENAK